VDVVEDKKQQTLFRELIAAFIYTDGVPREVRADNQKACVDQWELGKPVLKPSTIYMNFPFLDTESAYLSQDAEAPTPIDDLDPEYMALYYLHLMLLTYYGSDQFPYTFHCNPITTFFDTFLSILCDIHNRSLYTMSYDSAASSYKDIKLKPSPKGEGLSPERNIKNSEF